MANTQAPFGLMPVQQLGAGVYGCATRTFHIVSTNTDAFYIGSPVKLFAGADANGVPGITVAAAGDAFVGAVVDIYPVYAGVSMVGAALNLEQVSIPATKTKDYYVEVTVDPDQLYTIQGDATATNQTAAKANYNADMTITAPGTATYPQSATVIDSSTITTTSTRQLALLGLYVVQGNAFGAYATYLCKNNKSQYANGRTGI